MSDKAQEVEDIFKELSERLKFNPDRDATELDEDAAKKIVEELDKTSGGKDHVPGVIRFLKGLADEYEKEGFKIGAKKTRKCIQELAKQRGKQ